MIDVRRGADRFRTTAAGLDSWHSFSYGPHYDPDNLGFGVLLAHNEDRLAPGTGFDRHAHRGLDIVTWVLSGTLDHEHWIGPGQTGHRPTGHQSTGDQSTGDQSTGHRERLTAGIAQVLRTGSGVQHAEHAAAGSVGVHYLQMWLASAEACPGSAAEPGYQRRDFTAALAEAETAGSPAAITVASGRAGQAEWAGRAEWAGQAEPADLAAWAPLVLSQPGADLSVTRLAAGAEVELPSGPLVHVFIARGAMAAPDKTSLAAGDAVRRHGEPALTLVAVEPSDVLVWTLAPR